MNGQVPCVLMIDSSWTHEGSSQVRIGPILCSIPRMLTKIKDEIVCCLSFFRPVQCVNPKVISNLHNLPPFSCMSFGYCHGWKIKSGSEVSQLGLLLCRCIWGCALESHSSSFGKCPTFLCRKIMVYLVYGFVSLFFQKTRTMKPAWGSLHRSYRDSMSMDRHLSYWSDTQR